jgi:hypothetical protein
MHSHEITLIVAASIGLGVGVSITLLSIPQYDHIQGFIETLGLALGAAGIVIGIFIAYRQDKQTEKMDMVITNTSTMISETHTRENRVKSEILQRIRFNTNDIRTILVTTQRLIERHVRNPNEQPWEDITSRMEFFIGRTEELGRNIITDFGLIALLINNPLLVTTFWNRCVTLTIFSLQEVIGLDDPEDFNMRQPVEDGIRHQLRNLDEALAAIDREMPDEEQ